MPMSAGSTLDIFQGDFTVECWVYFIDLASCVVWAYGDTLAGHGIRLQLDTFGHITVQAAFYNGWTNLQGTAVLSPATWYHVAVVRQGTLGTLYVNGVGVIGVGSPWVTNPTTGTIVYLGQSSNSSIQSTYLNGFIDEMRVSSVARYTANFTPPNAPFVVNGTQLATTTEAFDGVMQWPYLDLDTLGRNKMLVGLDLVGEGNCSVQVAFNQADKSTFNDNPGFATSTGVTAPYFIAIEDTVPGQPLPIPINAPSYSVILTFTGSTASSNNWSWAAANLYVTDASGAGAMG